MMAPMLGELRLGQIQDVCTEILRAWRTAAWRAA